MNYFYRGLLLCVFCTDAFAQPVIKKIIAVKTSVAPKIDGDLSDAVWANAPTATDFIEQAPVAGRHELPEERTEVRVLYDNDAIYISARMYETDKKKVAHELQARDQVGNSDFVGIVIDTYLDGLNASGFYVTAAGGQFDAKYSNGGNEDPNWNAVWQSKVKIDDQGWTAEFKIPYSALRFPKKDVQTWGINFVRRRQGEQKELFWNEVNPKVNGFINQEGRLTGIRDVVPPPRLEFYPYFSTYVNNYPYNTPGLQNTTHSVNGGMDVKYGINQSFTVDMTLIPDFGQVQSDNQVLNLTPFRVKYNENRPFFTEGTELFNKGNLFYSRNIGGQPIDYGNIALNDHEAVVQNPSESRLLNATKFSGRTASGLGIGVLNAVTQSSYAAVQDSTTGNIRMAETSPTTNYNIIVLDQNLPHNSSVSLINTNVDRFGYDYNADVGGFVFSLNNKKNNYGVSGYGFTSNLTYPDKTNISGYSYEMLGGKTSGSFTWNLAEDFASANYNPNDLGYLNNPNYFDHTLNLQYSDYKPTKYFTQWSAYSTLYYSRRYQPSYYQALNVNLGANCRFKNFWFFNFNIQEQSAGHDFYVSRQDGLFYDTPGSIGFNTSVNTNQSKRLSGGFFFFIRTVSNGYKAWGNYNEVWYNLRLSNRFSFGEDVSYNPQRSFFDYLDIDAANTSVFSLYNQNTVENIFNLKYSFNSLMGLTLRVRHYWSKRNNISDFALQPNGSLTPYAYNTYQTGYDTDFNTFNIDMVYSWEFSPGSTLSIAYKNSALISNNEASSGYIDNLHQTLNNPQNNNLSLKILYYIDYQDLRKKRNKS